MSFSLKNLKKCKRPIKEEMSDFGKIISKKDLTDNIKSALWEYVKFRLFKLRHSSFTPDLFNKMIDDLAIHIINKDIKNITIEDVINNENEFIYEIANAIYHCNIHHLYYCKDLKVVIEKKLMNKPAKISHNEKFDNEKVKEYFRNIMV